MAEPKYTLSQNGSLGLDVLRALASQAVLIGHGISFFAIYPRLQPPGFPYIQNIAVVVFFLLSGFLISYSTLRKPSTYRFRDFFIDRFARIYSAYLPALGLVWAIDRLSFHLDPEAYGYKSASGLRTLVGNILMLQDHAYNGVEEVFNHQITSFGSARPFWTLAVEWWIYMLFGWIALHRNVKSKLLWIVVLVPLLIVPGANAIGGRGDGLALVWLFGVVIYLLLSGRRINATGGTLAIATIAFGALAVLLLRKTSEAYDVKLAALLAAMMFCALLCADRACWTTPPIVARAIRFVANYSFTLFLLHYSVLDFMVNHRVFHSPTANFAFAFIVTNVLSVLVSMATEAHHHRFSAWLNRKLVRKPHAAG